MPGPAIEVDALGSERDGPGCVRFNVLQDADDENVYYSSEVYVDDAAVDSRRCAALRRTMRQGARRRTRWMDRRN